MEAKANNKQQALSFNEASTLRVSTHSAEWIHIYKDIQDIWGRIYDLVEAEVGSSQVDETFDKEFSPHLSNLLDKTLDGFRQSVFCSLMESDKEYL